MRFFRNDNQTASSRFTRIQDDIPEGHLSCPECGSRDMVCIGENLVRYELHVVPASYTVKKHVQKVYKCLSCSDDEHTAITKAPVPNVLVSHSPVTASSMTMTLLNKFQLALSFNRQEKLWKMMGIAVSKATMANWILYAYRDWLKPLLGLMKEQLLEETVIHADETRVQVMKEKGSRNTSQSYMWLYSIRPFTIGRKNWVLSGSPYGAEASAGVYSMIETCLANGIDTRDYFMYIFEHMPQEENIHDRNVLQKYLPWNVPIENTNK